MAPLAALAIHVDSADAAASVATTRYVCLQDLTKDVLRIDAIPSTSLDGVKEWLGSMDIKFYESKVSTYLACAHSATMHGTARRQSRLRSTAVCCAGSGCMLLIHRRTALACVCWAC